MYNLAAMALALYGAATVVERWLLRNRDGQTSYPRA
jgi:hypothetical protein